MAHKDSMFGITSTGIIGLGVTSALPTPEGSAGIKSGFAKGVSKVGTALPTLGKIKGTSMVLGSLDRLKFQGGTRL